ncbi:hypothetical protein HMPREF3218_0201243 [Prevotella bivia]|nr:hypothetical protein HMPREF3218_0201243 [Prevotella bivia]
MFPTPISNPIWLLFNYYLFILIRSKNTKSVGYIHALFVELLKV